MTTIHEIPMKDTRRMLAELEGNKIKDPSEWETRQRVLDRHKNGKQHTGLKLPWSKTHDKVRLRPGELSVWAGYNAHNKSTLLSQIATWAAQEVKVGVGSFEMELEDTYNLMAQIAGGTANPTTRWVNDYLTWCQERIYVYDRLEAVPADQVLSGVDYMAGILGCKLIVIDSLMMCRGIVGDMDAERDFCHTLTGLAKHYQVHIALAHHMRKPQQGDESRPPNKFDLKGSGGIADLAHSIFICWNNKALKKLEGKINDGIPLSMEEGKKYEKIKDDCEQLIMVDKQRHGEFEGGIALWQGASRQFTSMSNRQSMAFDIPRMETA